jgi:hypothetical protein
MGGLLNGALEKRSSRWRAGSRLNLAPACTGRFRGSSVTASLPGSLLVNDKGRYHTQHPGLTEGRIVAYTCKWIYAYMTRNAMPEPETARLTITWSKEADHALRSFLGAQGMKKGDISKFIEEAVRWRIFHQTVREAREAFADVSPDELQKMIDESVEDVRAKHYRERAKRS